MHITVYGASGRVGREVVTEAIARGHTVTAFIHSHNPFGGMPEVRIAQGNITDDAAVSAALKGSDAVISTLGSWGTETKDIVSSGMNHIIPSMRRAGMKRIVTVTGAGAVMPDTPLTLPERLGRQLLNLMAPKILHDGERHLALLAKSGLAWTSVRAPVMTNGKKRGYTLRDKPIVFIGSVPRPAVAACMLDLTESTSYIGRAPVIGRGENSKTVR